MSTTVNSITALPKQMSIEIFSHLGKSELATCCRVNKNWQQLASANVLWTEVAKQ